jgi:hypothetical protein
MRTDPLSVTVLPYSFPVSGSQKLHINVCWTNEYNSYKENPRLATQEAGTGRINVLGQLRLKVHKTLSQPQNLDVVVCTCHTSCCWKLK